MFSTLSRRRRGPSTGASVSFVATNFGAAGRSMRYIEMAILRVRYELNPSGTACRGRTMPGRVDAGAMLETRGWAGKGAYLPGDRLRFPSMADAPTSAGKVRPDAERSP